MVELDTNLTTAPSATQAGHGDIAGFLRLAEGVYLSEQGFEQTPKEHFRALPEGKALFIIFGDKGHLIRREGDRVYLMPISIDDLYCASNRAYRARRAWRRKGGDNGYLA